MKNNKPLIIIGVIVLNVIVIFMIGQSLLGKSSSYDLKVAEAREYAEQELCSKAITAYDEALIMKDTLDLRLEMIEVYKKGIEIGEFTNTYDVVNSVTMAVDAYRTNPKVYDAACELFLSYGKYEDCAKILMQARDLHVSSESLDSYREKVRYQYSKYYAMYSNILPVFDDMYTVETEGNYTFLNSEASPNVKGGYTYASSFANGYAFVQTENADGERRSFVINKKGERQIYINDAETSSGVGKGKDKDGNDLLLLACKVGDTYSYYGMNGKKLFGEYQFAGRFRNNIAAVQEKDGKWKLINATGATVIDKAFNDVVLNEFDECAPRGFIFVKDGEKYHLYNHKMERIGNFECDGAKAFVGDYAAFKSGDLWGFVDTEGKIIIDAQYEDAKSFSNSMGAIFGGGSWRFINSKGEVIIQDTFDDVDYLSDNGICFVKMKGYWSYLKFFYTGK